MEIGNIAARGTDEIKRHWRPPASKCQIEDYQTKVRLSVCRHLYYSENLNRETQNLRLGRICSPRVEHR